MKHCPIPFRNRPLPGFLHLPKDPPRAIMVLAHGSSAAGQETPLVRDLADELPKIGLAVLRFDFPFVSDGKKTPNSEPVLVEAYLAAMAEARRVLPGIPVIAGGKSLGAKIALRTSSEKPAGAVLCGFPLHPPGHAGTAAAFLLEQYTHPVLLIQGTRDAFANQSLVREIVRAQRHISLHHVEGGDHSLRSPAGPVAIMSGILEAVDRWLQTILKR